MPRTITGYKILISCPGDVADEVGIIKDVIEDFNGRFTDSLGISLRTVHWSKDTYACFNQHLRQLLQQCLPGICA